MPGSVELAATRRAPERAAPVSLGLDRRSVDPPPPSPPVDVPIVPPDGELTGELAPVRPSPKPFRAARASRPGEVFALVVGINDYPGAQHDLEQAVADANTVDAALAGFGVPAANRVVLRDGQARRAQLVASIRALVATAGTQSTVVFAYAGHVRKLDGDTEAIVAADGGLLRDDELAALLAPLTSQPVWLLIAACYAGGFTEALAPGRVLTGAADANSLAYESTSVGGSYLVHFLAQEGWLERRAGPSVQEAFSYAQARISELYPDRKPVQMDLASGPLRFTPPGSSSWAPPSGSTPSPAPSPSSPPSSPPTSAPPKKTCLVLLCRQG